jgi:hypothetical protein
MKISLKFVGTYPKLEPLLEPHFMYFDHGTFLPLIKCDLMQIRFLVENGQGSYRPHGAMVGVHHRQWALTGLSLLWVPHFCVRRGASLKDLNPDTTSTSKAKCFFVSRWSTRKQTNVGKLLKLWGAIVIYRVGQITHRAITTNKRDPVIVTMHTSKLKTRQQQNI